MKMTLEQIKNLYEAAVSLPAFLHELVKQGFNEHGDEELATRAQDLENRRQTLLGLAERVETIGKNVQRRLEEKTLGYGGVSSSGELQFDIACALYYEAFQRFDNIMEVREREELQRAYDRRIDYHSHRLSGSVIQSLRMHNGNTLKQLARNLAQQEQVVENELEILMKEGLVRRYGTTKRQTYELTSFTTWAEEEKLRRHIEKQKAATAAQ